MPTWRIHSVYFSDPQPLTKSPSNVAAWIDHTKVISKLTITLLSGVLSSFCEPSPIPPSLSHCFPFSGYPHTLWKSMESHCCFLPSPESSHKTHSTRLCATVKTVSSQKKNPLDAVPYGGGGRNPCGVEFVCWLSKFFKNLTEPNKVDRILGWFKGIKP